LILYTIPMKMIHLRVNVLRTFREKSFGLIGANPTYPVMFTTRWGIHTFGMKHPIDVLILDNDHRVVRLVKHMLPNRVYFWPITYSIVVELPSGEIGKKSITTGAQITFSRA